MSQYNNFIEIYDTLVDVSTKLHEGKDPDAKGFDKALYMLNYALKKVDGINLHIENRNLSPKVKTHLAGVINAYQAQQNKLRQYKNKIAQLERALGERKKQCPCTAQETELKEAERIQKANPK